MILLNFQNGEHPPMVGHPDDRARTHVCRRTGIPVSNEYAAAVAGHVLELGQPKVQQGFGNPLTIVLHQVVRPSNWPTIVWCKLIAPLQIWSTWSYLKGEV